MKKLALLMMGVLLALGLTACSGNSGDHTKIRNALYNNGLNDVKELGRACSNGNKVSHKQYQAISNFGSDSKKQTEQEKALGTSLYILNNYVQNHKKENKQIVTISEGYLKSVYGNKFPSNDFTSYCSANN